LRAGLTVGAPVDALKRKPGDVDSRRLVVEVVEAETDLPASGVQVDLVTTEGATVGECQTGPSGRCDFEPGLDAYRLQASKAGYLAVARELQLLSGYGTVRISMSRSARVSGTVRDERSMRLAGAGVLFEPHSEVPYFNTFSTTSTGNGAFSLNLAPGAYSVSAALSGYKSERRDIVVLEDVDGLEVMLKTEGSIWFSGQVLSMSGGRPIPNVAISTPGGAGKTDPAGRFRFRMTHSPGPVTVELTPLQGQGSFESARESMQLNRNTYRVFRLREKRTFRLVAIDHRGEVVPASDLWVAAWSSSGEEVSAQAASASGRYSISKYPAYLRAGAKGNGSVSLPVLLQGYQSEVQVAIPMGGQLQGSVFDAIGALVQDFVVTLQDDEGHDLFSKSGTEPNGVFRFNHLADGVYQVRVEGGGQSPGRRQGAARVTVRGGQTAYMEIQLKDQSVPVGSRE